MPPIGGQWGYCEPAHILPVFPDLMRGLNAASAQARTITAPEGHIKGGSLLAHPANQTLLYNMVGRNRKRLRGFAEVCVHRR